MIYAGIGSRKTPAFALGIMEIIGTLLARQDWTLRSGGAVGADKAFEKGCDAAEGKREIFLASDGDPDWARKEAEKHIPENRPPFHTWKPYVQGLIARNMMQILGRNGDEPVNMVVCWTPASVKDGGGTGYALRCATSREIPIYNMHDVSSLERIRVWLQRGCLEYPDPERP